MPEILEYGLRLLLAVFLGGLIGYERELRSKEAGVRTHILVALGASLFMIISQHGFAGAARFDAARVAAGVVTGVGFLGGGLIIKKSHVSGLTTAAGLWVTASIGLGVGGGLYWVSAICAVLVLICMEVLSLYHFKLGDKEVEVVFSSEDRIALATAIDSLGKKVKNYALSKQGGLYRASVNLVVSKKESHTDLFKRLEGFPGVELEGIE